MDKFKKSNLIVLVFSLFFAFVVAEGILRIYIPQIGWRPYKDHSLGWSSKRYQEFVPTSDKRSEGDRRILFLGDSCLAGSNVSPVDDIFPKQLTQKLGKNISVQTFASSGWGTDQQYLAFLEKGKSWNPDLVVIAFCANNDLSNIFSNNHGRKSYKPYFVTDDTGRLQLYNYKGTPIEFGRDQGKKINWNRSYFYDLFYYFLVHRRKTDEEYHSDVDPRYRKFRFWENNAGVREIYQLKKELSWSPQKTNTHLSAYIHESFEMNSSQWKLLEAILKKWKTECERIRAELVIMLLPVTFKPQDIRFIAGGGLNFGFQTPEGSFTYRASEPRDRLKIISNRLGMEFFDPTGEFIEIIKERDLLLKCWPHAKDRHFSSVAHAILADQFHQYLLKNTFLSKKGKELALN